MSGVRHRTRGKHNFATAYNQRDPRAYYKKLRPLDYCLPKFARPVFLRCAELLARLHDKPKVKVVDLCCGYGVNGALLRHEVELDELYARYDDAGRAERCDDELRWRDREYFEAREQKNPFGKIVGVDVAENAVDYAEEVGLVDTGVVANLETAPTPPELKEHMADADIVTITGGVGYLSEATILRLYEHTDEAARPWFASFPLQATPFGPIERELNRFGLTTETWEEFVFPQRQFVDDGEKQRLLRELARRDIDPHVDASTGYLHAEFKIARPPDEIRLVPLHRLVPKGTSRAVVAGPREERAAEEACRYAS